MEPGDIVLVPRPTPLPTDLLGWLQTFARNTFFASWNEEEAQKLMEEAAEICRPDNYWCNAEPGTGRKQPEGGVADEGWEIMYVRLRGTAVAK